MCASATLTLALQSDVGVSEYSVTIKRTVKVLYQAMKVRVGPLPKCELRVIAIKIRYFVERKYIRLLISYCCVI